MARPLANGAEDARSRRRRTLLVGTLLAFGLVVLLVQSVYVLPDRLVTRDLGRVSVAQLKPSELLTAKDNVRKSLLQGIGGLLFLATAFFTWRQLQISRESQITEQFNKAIDHLGSDQVDVRIGGIYALQRIADTSERERAAIIEVLTAYVREHAPKPEVQDGLSPSRRFRALLSGPAVPGTPNPAMLPFPKPDVQAAVIVLVRRDAATRGGADLDLTGVDLCKAYLAMPKVKVAQLQQVNFQEALLQASNLEKADLRHGDLWRVDLRWSNLKSADLRKAYLREAVLRDTELQGADLRETQLQGADLRDANLEGTRLQGAEVDRRTRWPAGFKATGVRLVDD